MGNALNGNRIFGVRRLMRMAVLVALLAVAGIAASPAAVQVPEPAAAPLMAMGFAGLLLLRRRQAIRKGHRDSI